MITACLSKKEELSLDAGDKPSILLVSRAGDETCDQERKLRELGYTFVVAADGDAAISLCERNEKLDLALIDIDSTPALDAAETADRIRRARDLPLIFLVGGAATSEKMKEMENVVSYGYIHKDSSAALYGASLKTAIRLHKTLTRKAAPNKRNSDAQMFQAVLDAIPQYICWKDRNSIFQGCNKNHSDLFGLTDTASIIGKSDWEMHRVAEQIEKFIRDDRAVMESDSPKYHILEEASYPNGETRWLETNKVPLHDEDGKVSGIMIAYSDITEKKRIEDSLAQERYLMGALMDNSSDLIYFKDLNSRFLRANRAMAAYFGQSDPSEMIGKTDYDFFTKEYAAQTFQDEAFVVHTESVLRKEELNILLDGREVWMLTEKIPLKDKNDLVVGTFGISRNISDRKRSEETIKRALEEKETLLRELYHRTKNNMGVIISLLNLQSQNFKDKKLRAAFTEAKDRIYAMALVHEKLYEARDLSNIDLGDYIGDLSSRLIQSYKIMPGKITIVPSIESVSVPIDLAIPCGLILNELMSNALKYAFPKGRVGSIFVSLKRLENNEIELSVRDNGIGVRRGFNLAKDGLMGLQTVQALTENQLRGQLGFNIFSGVECVVKFKLNHYQARV